MTTSMADGTARAEVIREAAAMHFDKSVTVERRIGEVRGVVAEIWRSGNTGSIALAVAPTANGFTVLAVGRPEEAEVFVRVGLCVLRAIGDVLPLALGDVFRAPPSPAQGDGARP